MDYEKFEKFIETCNFDVQVIGKSVLGKNIYALNKEFDKKYDWVLLTAGMHAREHLTCDFLCQKLASLNTTQNYNISALPLVNPDGADIAINGAINMQEVIAEKLININGSEDFSMYKANANGVDLNNNWDARWEKQYTNKKGPSSQGFYGDYAMSEPETIALAKWTEKVHPFMTISFHLKGEEIYFDFFQRGLSFKRDKQIAEIFANDTGYKIKATRFKSSGGYKDWCVQKLKIPALTIELGSDMFPHPYPKEQLNNICTKQENLFENIEKCLKIYQKFKRISKK